MALISSGLKPARLISPRASVALRSEWPRSSRACRTTLVSTPAAEAIAEREQVAHLLGRDPVELAAEQRRVRDPAVGLQHQREEELHAELAVAEPRLALGQPLERADVDEGRPGAAPLHVVGRAVLEDQPLVEGRAHQLQGQQGGVLEHRERPLEGPRQVGDPLVAEDGGEAGGWPAVSGRVEAVEQLGPDDRSRLLGGGEEAGWRRAPRSRPARSG